MTKITDYMGDTLEIDPSVDGAAGITATENSRDAYIVLDATQAFEAAMELLRLVGMTSVATPATIHGKDSADERLNWNTDALGMAIAHGRSVKFAYQKVTGPGGVIENRRLTPEHVYQTRAGNSVVVGEDPDRENTRVFRLDRIVGTVEVTA